jgi:hypothetical protein
MIVSHKYKYIFIKTVKTAGTSIEISLSTTCGPNDIISAISPDDEILRQNAGGRGPQNTVVPIRRYRPRDLLKLGLKGKRVNIYNHIGAPLARRYLGPDIWDSYHKVSVLRNPWDQIISHWFFMYPQLEGRPTLSQFIESPATERLKRGSLNLLSIDGKVATDQICRFESLNEDLEDFRNRVGIEVPLQLPRAKGGLRIDRRPYREHYSEADAARVAEIFRSEIELLKYEF